MKGCVRTYCADVDHCMAPDNCGRFENQVLSGCAVRAAIQQTLGDRALGIHPQPLTAEQERDLDIYAAHIEKMRSD